MCHNSGIESEQIERFKEFGLPQKAVRTVKYTMRKREQQQRLQQQQQQQQQQEETVMLSDSDSGTDLDNIDTTAAVHLTETVSITAASHNNNNSSDSKAKLSICPFAKQRQQQKAAAAAATTTTTTTTAAATEQRSSSDLAAQQQRKLSSMEPSMDDVLAIGTQMTRKFNERCYCLIAKLHGSRLYTILTSTTQPAHLLAIGILSFVLLTVGPDLTTTTHTQVQLPTTTTQSTTTTTTSSATTSHVSTLATLAFLGAFATHFGSQIWMTFVSGLSLYFSLPRHTFGQCQQILFPKYFALNAMLSISMLIIYVKYFLSGWSMSAGIQLGALSLTACIEVIVRLYLAPPMLQLMHEKYRIEDAIGSGQEVGSLVQGDLVECPHYQRIHKSFRRIHMTIAIGNMIVLLATCLQLYFLALKIRIS